MSVAITVTDVTTASSLKATLSSGILATSETLESALASGGVTNIDVTSTPTVIAIDPAVSPSSSGSNNNLAIGLGVGLGVGIPCLLLVIFLMARSKPKQTLGAATKRASHSTRSRCSPRLPSILPERRYDGRWT